MSEPASNYEIAPGHHTGISYIVRVLMPCRFCGSTDLLRNLWIINDEEAEAIECRHCDAGAPRKTWNKPILYRGFHIDIADHPKPDRPFVWDDRDNGDAPVSDQFTTIAEAMESIDEYIEENL